MKFVISISCTKDRMFIVYNPMLMINSNNANFDITLMPLFVQYTIRSINREQLIINGVLYKNWDKIKLFILYKIVIPNDIRSRENVILIIKPILFPYSDIIFSCSFCSGL